MTLEQVEDLANRLHGLQLPEALFELFPGTTITDIQPFLDAQLLALRHAPDSKVSQPCKWRLERFLELVEPLQ